MSVVVDVVLPVTTGDVELLERRVAGLLERLDAYYASRHERLRAAVLVSGDALPFVLRGSPTLADDILERLRTLVERGRCELLVCAYALARAGAAASDLVPFAKTTPLAAAALIDAQREGVAVLPPVT